MPLHADPGRATGEGGTPGPRAPGLPKPGASSAPLAASLQVHAEDSLAAAGRKVVGQQVWRMRADIPGALDGVDPESLHDLRVATRRLRSALRILAPVLGQRRCDALRRKLGWIGRRLGDVRDLDVFILNLQAQAQRLGEARDAAGLLVEELSRQRLRARAALRASLASRRFDSLLGRLEALASSPSPRRPRGAQALRVAEAAPILIRKAQKRVLRLGRSIGPDAPAGELHRLRILAKRLRYTSEFFREAFADPAAGTDPLAEYIRVTVRLQDCLGDHQDAMVAMVRIRELAKELERRGALPPQRLVDLGALIQVQREIVQDRRRRFAKLWPKFDRPLLRKRLALLGPAPPAPASAA